MCAHTCEMIEVSGTSLLGHGPSWYAESFWFHTAWQQLPQGNTLTFKT